MKLMKVALVLVIMLVATARVSLDSNAPAPPDAREYRRGEIVVEIEPGASIEAVNARHRTTTTQWIYGTNFYRLSVPSGKKESKWLKRLKKDKDVLSASLNAVVTSPTNLFGRSTQGFPEGFARPGLSLVDYQSQQALFDLLKLEEVRLRSRGEGALVAIIDTGVDRTHPYLVSRLWRDDRRNKDIEGNRIDNDADGLVDDFRGWDFVGNDNDPAETAGNPNETVAGHGTFIAGLVAMLAPESRMLPIRAFGANGLGDAFTVAAAVKYAADHGADVINLSLGSPVESELLKEAIKDARERGITLVAAVGNDNDGEHPQFPSSSAEVMAVAAVNLEGTKARFSNFGPHVDVTAPGTRLISAYPDGGYAAWSGTSFAAPFVSAEAALIVSFDPTHREVKRTIEATAVDIDPLNPGYADKLGRGRIDPLAALRNLTTEPDARPVYDLHRQTELTAAADRVEARGKATATVAGAKQEFFVEAARLSVRTSHRLVVDGQTVAEGFADPLGSLRFKFSTDAGFLPVAGALNPVTGIRHVQLEDNLGRVILQGDFLSDGAGTEPPRRFLEKVTRLISTGILLQAAGRASVKIDGARQALTIELEGLTTGPAYHLLVDGIYLGEVESRSGFARLHFIDDASAHTLPPALIPVTSIRRVELLDGRVPRGRVSERINQVCQQAAFC
ncbi:MAG TPA: S8 family serine peptidase [Blastocatellia bacterium]|nr:S8 family serine peptidase [Blastocatellia bacterium]